MNKKFNKKLIIEQLTIIKNYEMIKCKPLKVKAYNKVIDNLIAYPYDIKNLNDLKEIKGIGVKILALLTELYETGEISYINKIIKKDKNIILKKKDEHPFNKQLIIDNLITIRDYEIFNNEIFKYKAYNKVIDNLYNYPNDIKDLKDLKEIKGIGEGMLLMLAELRKNGKISYIENVIKKDKNYKIKKISSKHPFNKKLIIDNLITIRDYENYKNEKYKVKAYSNVINNILIYKDDIKDLNDLKKIEGIGKSIFDKLKELYQTGKISYIENNINNDDIYSFKQELLNIYGIGPIKANKIVDNGIKSIDELRKNHLDMLNAKQQIGIKYYNDFKKRIPLNEYKKHISILNKDLKKNKLIFDFVGSYRRESKSMGDIDLLIMENPKFNFKDYISKLIDDNYIIEVLAFGKNKFMGIVKLPNESVRRLDILIAPVKEYYFSLLYFTGSNIFNIGIRYYVKINFDLSLSEHGFGKNINTSINSEEDIFKFLKLKYVKPKDRENFYI
jgi:DNA polymerase beta